MRTIAGLLLLSLAPLLAGCESSFWDQPARPAPSGITSSNHGTDPRGGGAEPSFTARGSQRTIGFGR